MSTNLIVILIAIIISLLNITLYAISKPYRKVSVIIARLLIGIVFLYSGFVKAVDPLGSMYKFNDYFLAFGIPWLSDFALFLGFLLFCFEFLLGFAFVFNIKLKFFSWIMMLFMLFFFILTLILAIKNPVSDCGCFGDALILTNWETFYKNIALMLLALNVFAARKRILNRFPNITQYLILLVGLAIILWVSVFSLRHLPLIDFMHWKKGTNISEQVVDTPEIADIKLVYKHKMTGEVFKYTSKTLPWQDTAFFNKLEFVDQEKTIIQEYKPAPIHDFLIDDSSKVNHNAEIINNPEFQFLLVIYDLTITKKEVLPTLNSFYQQCVADSFGFVALCGSDFATIYKNIGDYDLKYPFFGVDGTALKSVVRSNPGMVLLKNGVVLDKWAWRDFPSYDEFKKKIPEYELMLNEIKPLKAIKQ